MKQIDKKKKTIQGNMRVAETKDSRSRTEDDSQKRT